MSKRILLIVGPVLQAGTAFALSAPSKAPADAPNAEARLEAARTTFELLAADFRAGKLHDTDRLYAWSRRILESQRELDDDRVAALEAHLGRMGDLKEIARTLFEAGQTSRANVTALEFYRLEAESWLENAKAE